MNLIRQGGSPGLARMQIRIQVDAHYAFENMAFYALMKCTQCFREIYGLRP